jgi:hypothetical protein
MSAMAASLAAASPAPAAVTVGQTFAPTQFCGASAMAVQTTSPGSTYTVPSDGVITSWSFHAGNQVAPTKLKVAHQVAGDEYTVVGESSPVTPATDQLNTFGTRIPVRSGDVIGLTILGTTPVPCAANSGSEYIVHAQAELPPGTTATFFPGQLRLNVSAVVEPDCDGDGTGDETQDGDLSPCSPGDTTPPETTITNGPKAKAKKKIARFEFSGTDARAVAGFECSLDGGAFAACSSPHTVKVKKGNHTFEVRATDTAGNTDASVATYTWKVKKKKRKK